jgi:hypothetical protein
MIELTKSHIEPLDTAFAADGLDPIESAIARGDPASRSLAIELAVRRALTLLTTVERSIIEGYYFDGRSMPQLSRSGGMPLDFVRIAHRRALARLEGELASLVERMFGLEAVHRPECVICGAPWRTTAEAILDGKTPDTTWGQIATRIERAVGWKAASPQTLIVHQRKHRRFEKITTTTQEGDSECTHHIICADNIP